MTMCRPTVGRVLDAIRARSSYWAPTLKRGGSERATQRQSSLGGGRPTVGHWAPTLLEDSRASS